MNYLRWTIRTLGGALFAVAAIAPGCGSDDGKTGDEDNIVPADAATLFDQAGVCDQTLKRHVSVRETDMKEGTIRWNCADVKGVEGNSRGQEYCEYHAVQDGKFVTATSEIDTAKPLYCFFTSVYHDVDGKEVVGDRDAELAKELSKAENLNAKVAADEVRMVDTINSRGAATLLITDCEGIDPDLNEERQVACYQASLQGSGGDALRTACRGKDLSNEALWKKAQALGAKVLEEKDGEAFDSQRDIIGCLSVHRAAHPGAAYRNSDPMICGRVFRAKQECGCSWSALPDALEGFLFTGWTSESMPPGCKRAVIDGVEYPHLTLCQVPTAEAEELELDENYSNDLQKFCNERFAKDLVMKAPLRAVEVKGSCKTETKFCAAFTAGEESSGPGAGGGGSGGSGAGGDSSAGGGGSGCAHDVCEAGDKLDASCSPCATAVCDADSFCCMTAWDDQCVAKVPTECGQVCGS